MPAEGPARMEAEITLPGKRSAAGGYSQLSRQGVQSFGSLLCQRAEQWMGEGIIIRQDLSQGAAAQRAYGYPVADHYVAIGIDPYHPWVEGTAFTQTAGQIPAQTPGYVHGSVNPGALGNIRSVTPMR
jgi:hypothetical protein